jgi:hypothetical protein
LLSNILRTKAHPTLRTVLDVAEIFSLTLDGAHRLFGYEIDQIRDYDLQLNGGRTHVIESYPFYRDLPVDLPSRVGEGGSSGSYAALRDLVPEWQTEIPIRTIEDKDWRRPGVFYAHVGTMDSHGSSLPPGSMALVEPISKEEEQRPNPRSIYLLQFGNGYRFSQCVVTRGKLLLLVSGRHYTGPQEFTYPGGTRIAGRVRMFALSLPLPDYPDLGPLPSSAQSAPLILPWEHASRDLLFSAKHRRFGRLKEERAEVQAVLQAVFAEGLTARTERRYRRPSDSQPHVDTLMQMAILNTARYSDSLRVDGSLPSDQGRFSLDTLLAARSFAEVIDHPSKAHPPAPVERWQDLRKEFPEWPAPLAMKYPRPQSLEDRVIQLPTGIELRGLSPAPTAGSLLLLDDVSFSPEHYRDEPRGTGWSRPIYALRRGAEVICGYLGVDQDRYVLTKDPRGQELAAVAHRTEAHQLSRVCGIAVPV